MGKIQQNKGHKVFRVAELLQFYRQITVESALVILGCLILLGLTIYFLGGRTIEVKSDIVEESGEEKTVEIRQVGSLLSSLSGLPCENYNRRSFAIVFASDPEARPLSGLYDADLVFEMPVITGSITRMLAVYACQLPEEIGSLRSARHDFIPLAEGIDAVLAHWGGSHFALDELNAGVMDNLSALSDPYEVFYRKNTAWQPHNGFTSGKRLLNGVEKLGYRSENEFEGYPFEQKDESKMSKEKVLRIGYARPYNISFEYIPETNSYLRWRGNLQEIDANNDKQIEAKNIIVMKAVSRQIEGDYNDLEIEGKEGECSLYQNGEVLSCVWKKGSNNKAKLYFLDVETNEEILFVPGQTWIEIVEPEQKVTWD